MTESNDDTNDAQSTNLRANWTRTAHRNLRDSRTVRAIDETGSAVIGRWEHKDHRDNSEARVRYLYEPSADDPYLVELPELGISERFGSRSAGGTFNKELMTSPEVVEELAVHTCGAQTADGDSCQVQVGESDAHCHLHQPEDEAEA
jgi:hypothetical protein